ncbi:SRPBCC family protein [Niabella sp. CC-SYL272]|uniref:SRPBCC family protein n=1 Tax=Niabella agricola TaxID=2891571 RepID=UPI001F33A49A|nr:SRPBCC family protein [Niabella agricola]MCF3108318.1 SRPBCC family protein [Niabella agricola]
MKGVQKSIEVFKRSPLVFDLFVNRLHNWWPRAYTWSGDALVEIRIDARVDGWCTETGPLGFRCDWGRVLQVVTGEKLVFLWQISPLRTPEPDPDKASLVQVQFEVIEQGATRVTLWHTGFENHGEGAADYARNMDSDKGWKYILETFAQFAGNYTAPV